MVEYNLDRTFNAIGDPTRRDILSRLSVDPARVTEIAEPYPMSLNAVSKHLRVLEEAGLVRRHVQGRDHIFSLNPQPLDEASSWVERHRTLLDESARSWMGPAHKAKETAPPLSEAVAGLP